MRIFTVSSSRGTLELEAYGFQDAALQYAAEIHDIGVDNAFPTEVKVTWGDESRSFRLGVSYQPEFLAWEVI